MKHAVIICIFVLFIAMSTSIYPHGLGTHAAHYSSIIALNDQYKTLLEDPRYKPYFIYGSMFPDIQYAANYKATLQNLYQKIRDVKIWEISEISSSAYAFDGLTYEILTDQIPDKNVAPYPFGIDTHHDKYGMAFAEYLLQQCSAIDPPGPNPGSNGTTDAHDARNMKLAFALGYYAHLSEDVAAHDFLIPKLTSSLNLGDIELVKNSESFAEDPNSQTEGIVEGIIDHFYGDNSLVTDVVYNHVWVTRSQLEPSIAQMDFTTGYAHLLFNGPNPTYYDAQGGWPEMNPVLLFFNDVLNDWYYNNPYGLPTSGTNAYKKTYSPMSPVGLTQLATIFRFVNRFYPAIAGHQFNGFNRLDEVLADWVSNHLDLSATANTLGITLSIATGGLLGLFNAINFNVSILSGLAYPSILEGLTPQLATDARSLVSLMLADIDKADEIVQLNSDKINVAEYNKLKASILFTNPTSIINSYWAEYKTLGTTIYDEIGPGNKWYSDWSPYHSNSMAWGAISSLNNLIPSIYTSNSNVAIYDAYFEINGNRITGPQASSIFQNNPSAKIVVELYNTSNVNSQSLTLRVKKDHSSSNYMSDVLKASTSFTIDHDPLNYNTNSREKVELSFPISLSDLSGFKGYYFELVDNANSKVMFSSSFEQFQEQLNLTANYARLYGTYDEGKWPISLGLLQSVATVNLNSAQFPEGGGSSGTYKINGIVSNNITAYIDDYIHLEAVPPVGWVFYKWSDDNTENPRTYRVPSTNNTLYAIYKGVQKSNNSNAYLNNSQNKFVRTPNNILHNVYESLGRIWYEISTDGGSTWRLMNDAKPLDSGEAKHPSIDIYSNYVGIVWQEKNGANYRIKFATFYNSSNDYILGNLTTVPIIYPESYNNDIRPALGWGYGGELLIIWEGMFDGPFGVLEGIAYKHGNATYNSVTFDNEGGFDASSNNSINPSIAVHKAYQSPLYFQIAWEQNNNLYSRQIYYVRPHYSSGTLNIPAIQNISTGNNKIWNYNPSIIAWPDGSARVNWISDSDGFDNTFSTFRDPGTSRFWHFGYKVRSSMINKSDDNTCYFIAWSEQYSTNNKFTDNYTLSTIRTLNTTGKAVQLSNGATRDYMHVSSFVKNTPPFFFTLSNSIGSYYAPSKTNNPLAVNIGRGATLAHADAQFYFTIGGIKLNDEPVSFIEAPQNMSFNSVADINQYMETEPFSINSESNFTVEYATGLIDSVAAANIMLERNPILFKLELIEAGSNTVLKELEKIEYSSQSLSALKTESYILNTDGISELTVKFRLTVETEDEWEYFIVDNYSDVEPIEKPNLTKVNLLDDLIVHEYFLGQNYPNPFNPTTQIKFAIPQDGIVRLKIYDVLGKEVKTLLNEYRNKGNHGVQFNASDLASGVYLYQIKANDFTATKKMMLLK